MCAAFFDELSKIAAARPQFKVPNLRSGKRPMSVETLLKKEKDGTLFKHSADVVHYSEGRADPGAAMLPKKRGEVPSREDFDAINRQDGREAAIIVPGTGRSYNGVADISEPQER